MHHFVSLPILLPLLAGIILLLPPCGKNVTARRFSSVMLALITLASSLYLLSKVATGEVFVYAIGNWQAPFGIVLVADIMAAIMLVLTSFLALCCVIYSLSGCDEDGGFFHPLIHFLLMGVNGAFLTGDLFNLFVFFEVLLIASYSLLMHNSDKRKTRAALHYVILNLVGSSVFLISLGILYGVLGTLNIADMMVKAQTVSGDDLALLKVGGLLLLIVFALKSAVIPLQFWLPATYAAATPIVAAMFAIMTKVGVYAIIRVYNSIFGAHAPELSDLAATWLWPAALITLIIGALGVLASRDLRVTVANLVLVSVGTLIAAVAIQTKVSVAAALYYVVHSTLVTAALFMLCGVLGAQRGKVGTRLVPGREIAQPKRLGTVYILLVLAVVGMPPFSGFIAKVWLLDGALEAGKAVWFWSVYLVVSLLCLVALTRAGSQLFWRYSGHQKGEIRCNKWQWVALFLLVACSPLLSVFSGPITELTHAAAEQVFNPDVMRQAVLGAN